MLASLPALAADPRCAIRIDGTLDPQGRCVLYWMRRAQRALDNPALEAACMLANELDRPVLVFFALRPGLPEVNARHFSFMLEGLADTATRLAERGIGFLMRRCDGRVADEIGRLADAVRPAAVVTDENPLGGLQGWRRLLPDDWRRPLVSVDADVIVPSVLLTKEQFAARTIRPRIHAQLERFLQPIVHHSVKVAWRGRLRDALTPGRALLDTLPLDRSVAPVSDVTGGPSHARARLAAFLRERLGQYGSARNRPEAAGTSELSPYLHYGQIGPHTIALAVRDADAPAADRRAFLEELIVRRELAINFVRFNPRYKSIASSAPWALRTLRAHAADPRPYLYKERQLEQAETHDELWNAAQRQMVRSGWMHGYLRMYWAKKIFEWNRSAATAFRVAVRLNDRYELDGRDANGYAGIAWAIGGKHDRAWGPERPIYGKIRYMSAASTSRKFDSRAYLARWRA